MWITAYKIAGPSSPTALTAEVNGRIKDGWQPLGPPTVLVGEDGVGRLVQALVKSRDSAGGSPDRLDPDATVKIPVSKGGGG